MTARKKNLAQKSTPGASDLKKIDEYVLSPKDYEEIPELTEEWFQRADLYKGGKLIKRGRPPSPKPKEAMSLRLDPEVIAYFRRSGRGWQTRINDVLRKAAKLPVKTRKKA